MCQSDDLMLLFSICSEMIRYPCYNESTDGFYVCKSYVANMSNVKILIKGQNGYLQESMETPRTGPFYYSKKDRINHQKYYVGAGPDDGKFCHTTYSQEITNQADYIKLAQETSGACIINDSCYSNCNPDDPDTFAGNIIDGICVKEDQDSMKVHILNKEEAKILKQFNRIQLVGKKYTIENRAYEVVKIK